MHYMELLSGILADPSDSIPADDSKLEIFNVPLADAEDARQRVAGMHFGKTDHYNGLNS